jgi:uncharacterized membrane protein HdeD (DUF308 family)
VAECWAIPKSIFGERRRETALPPHVALSERERNVTAPLTLDGPPVAIPEGLRKIGTFLVCMGIALIILGILAIGSAFIATLATVMVFGILLIVGAIFQVVAAVCGRSWRGFFLHLLAGVLYLVVGIFMIDHPVEAALGVTLMVAAGLVASGIVRIFLSVIERFDGWGWMLFSGLISLLLGIAIWRQWPLSGLWVIGLFVGIDMLSCGISWLLLGLAARSAPKPLLN